MHNKKIVISGGPGSGKTTIIEGLRKRGYYCLDEVSREYITAGKAAGKENHFEEDPLAFSKLLWRGRIDQYQKADEHFANKSDEKVAFFDRSLIDVVAYLHHKNATVQAWEEALKTHPYDRCFLVAPVAEIYQTDDLRMESFEQSMILHQQLIKTYRQYGEIVEVPFLSPEERVDFILKHSSVE